MKNTNVNTLLAIANELKTNSSKCERPFVVLAGRNDGRIPECSYSGNTEDLLELYLCHSEMIMKELKKTRSRDDVGFILANALSILMADVFFEDEFVILADYSIPDIDESSFPSICY